MRRSLVLGGGGIVGIAWLVGVIEGLGAHGIDLRGTGAADEVIGTSAGSLVGAMLASGASEEAMRSSTLDDSSVALVAEALPHVDLAAMINCFSVWGALANGLPESLATVGALALQAPTMAESEWSKAMAIVGKSWPATPYRCTAVNARTGEFVVWDSSSGVELDLAVTSSCTVPTLFPPITIGNDRYIDGGVRSGSNADLARGSSVLVLAPIGSNASDPMDVSAAVQLENEAALLRSRNATVVTMMPDDEANAATLSSPLGRMEPQSRLAALEHGRRQAGTLVSALSQW